MPQDIGPSGLIHIREVIFLDQAAVVVIPYDSTNDHGARGLETPGVGLAAISETWCWQLGNTQKVLLNNEVQNLIEVEVLRLLRQVG